MSKISVAVLGATGMVGQRFVQMLEDHPWFEIEGLYASERSNGKRLADVMKVRDHVYLDETMDRKIETMDIKKIAKNCRIAFSGIPSELAGPTETELAEAGVRELIVVAQDTSRYGLDLYGERRLAPLLRDLSAMNNVSVSFTPGQPISKLEAMIAVAPSSMLHA